MVIFDRLDQVSSPYKFLVFQLSQPRQEPCRFPRHEGHVDRGGCRRREEGGLRAGQLGARTPAGLQQPAHIHLLIFFF